MAIFTTTTASITAIFCATSALLRRHISRNWISLEKDTNYEDLTGKTILITGGNVGLGYETAKDLSRRNAKNIILACRDTSKGQKSAKAICKATGKDNVECLELDLSSLASVRNFVTMIQSEEKGDKYSSIDVIICNAGVWVPDTETENETSNEVAEGSSTASTPLINTSTAPSSNKTNDGFEIHFGINHLSHHLLATSLQENLAKSGDGRIVFVSSSLMKFGSIDLDAKDFIYTSRKKPPQPQEDDTEGETINSNKKKSKSVSFAPIAYCDSKLMNYLCCRHLSTTLPPTITTYSVCPGFCRSSLGRHVSFPIYKKLLLAPIMLLIQRTAQQGAQNIVFAVVEKKNELVSGAMYTDGKLAEEHMEHGNSFGEDFPKKFFDLSETLLKEKS